MEDLVNQKVVSAIADEQEDENPFFKRLPNELVISQILDKICEAKSLCICSLVPKHLSSLVLPNQNCFPENPTSDSQSGPQFHHLSCLLSSSTPPLPHHFPQICCRGLCCCRPPMLLPRLISLLNFFLNSPAETEANGGISSIKVPLMKWKIDFSSDSFILLIAPRRVDDDGDVISIFVEKYGFLRAQILGHLSIAFWTLSLMETLFSFLPESLVHVVITDSKNRGMIVLGETDLVQMRIDNSRRNATNYEDGGDEEMFRFLDEPSIELPSSGWPMDIVTLFLDKNEDTEADYLVIKDAFEGKGEVLVESVMELLKEIRASP